MKKEKTSYHQYYMTQQEIADAFGGVSRAAIGQEEAKAMEKFRKEFERRGYKMEDLIGGMQ